MNEATDLGRSILELAVRSLEPLEIAASDPAAASALIELTGWDLSAVLGLGSGELAAAVAGVGGAADAVRDILTSASDDGLDVATITSAVTRIARAGSALYALGDGWAPPSDLPADLPARFLDDLVGHLAVLAASRYHPVVKPVLDLIGVLAYAAQPAIVRQNGAVIRPAGPQPRLDLGALTALVTDPADAVLGRFGLVGDDRRPADEAADALFPAIAEILRAAGLTAWHGDPGTKATLTPEQRAVLAHTLRVVWTHAVAPEHGGFATLDAAVALRDDGAVREVLIVPSGSLAFSLTRGTWTAGAAVRGQPGAVVVRADGVRFTGAGSHLQLELTLARPSGTPPLARLGAPDGLRLELGGATLGVRADLGSAEGAPTVDGGFSLELHGLRIVVTAAGDDGFLGSVLSAEPVVIDFALGVEWTPRTGLRLRGGAGLVVDKPLDVAFGPIAATGLTAALHAGEQGLTLETGIALAAQLGPFSASIKGIGLQAQLAAGDPHGGPQLTVGFKPPTGVGLAIESDVVSGGGFLEFDELRGQYTGAFELTIAETIAVKVVGMISTKLPDGRPGFALLIIITAEGFTPIQLGMGFSLTGIGGLLALNRTIDVEAVRGGLKSGVLDTVLFPKDPVRNAARVISTLNGVFPQAPDRLLVGPMATISWGSPPIVNVRLAVLLELPDPLRIVVLASLTALLPAEKEAVLELRVDAVGVLDFKRGELSLDASIHDSRILKFGLTGDLALRLRWGEDPQFLLAVGGFHPRYIAPPGFPTLDRVALTLSDSDNPRLRFECYFALTSNSIQFGARVELYAAAAGFELSGSAGFDALIQWSPFQFAIDIFARLGVRFGGAVILAINLELGLNGPDPWRAHGLAEVQFLFIKAQVSFELQIGEDRTPPPPELIDAAELLWTALTDRGNWSAVLPESERPGVTLSDRGTGAMLAHPLARISVRQRVLPLDTRITRLGAHVPKGGPASFHAQVSANGTTDGLDVSPVSDRFALGQYQARSDDQRLTEPDFVERPAGFSVASGAMGRGGPELDTGVTFETVVLEPDDLEAGRLVIA